MSSLLLLTPQATMLLLVVLAVVAFTCWELGNHNGFTAGENSGYKKGHHDGFRSKWPDRSRAQMLMQTLNQPEPNLILARAQLQQLIDYSA